MKDTFRVWWWEHLETLALKHSRQITLSKHNTQQSPAHSRHTINSPQLAGFLWGQISQSLFHPGQQLLHRTGPESTLFSHLLPDVEPESQGDFFSNGDIFPSSPGSNPQKARYYLCKSQGWKVRGKGGGWAVVSTELLSRRILSQLLLSQDVLNNLPCICSSVKNISTSPKNAFLEGGVDVCVCELNNYQWGTISGILFSSEKNFSFSWKRHGALAGLGSRSGVPTWTQHGVVKKVDLPTLRPRELKGSWLSLYSHQGGY